MGKYGEELSLSEMHEIQLRMMDDLDSFCRKHSLRYSLSGGSLLGAVRHKGFIPWDDDVDVMMPRADYEEFKRLYPKEAKGAYLVDFDHDDSYYKVFTKIFDDSTTMIQRMVERGGVFIDLFAIDGQPSDPQETLDYFAKYRKLNHSIRWHTDYFHKSPYFLLRTVVRALKGHSTKKRNAEIAEVKALLAKYPYETSEYAGATMGGSGIHTHQKKEVYSKFAEYDFEGRKYFGLKDYDTYLTGMYGDYMQLPPEKDRKSKHMARFYRKSGGNR